MMLAPVTTLMYTLTPMTEPCAMTFSGRLIDTFCVCGHALLVHRQGGVCSVCEAVDEIKKVDHYESTITFLRVEVERLDDERAMWHNQQILQEAEIKKLKDRLEASEGVRRVAEIKLEQAEELLASIWLYVDWRYLTKQMTTPQKELWADAVDARGIDTRGDGRADRWWRR